MERQRIIDMAWDLSEPFLFCDKEVFERGLDGWDLAIEEVDGVPAFITCVQGPAFHIESLDAGKAVPLSRIKAFLQPIIDRYGYAETHTPRHETRQRRFNLALGFFETGCDELDVFYRIEKIRGAPCH